MSSIFPTQIRKVCWFSLDSLFGTNKTLIEMSDKFGQSADCCHEALYYGEVPTQEQEEEEDNSFEKSKSGDGDDDEGSPFEQVQGGEGSQVEVEQEVQIGEGYDGLAIVGGGTEQLPLTRSRKRQHQPDKDCSTGARLRRIRKTQSDQLHHPPQSTKEFLGGEEDTQEPNDYVRVLRSGKTRVNSTTNNLTSKKGSAGNRGAKKETGTNHHLVDRSRGGGGQDLKMGAIKCTSSNCDKTSSANNNLNSLSGGLTSQQQNQFLCNKCNQLVCNNGKGKEVDLSMTNFGTGGKSSKKRVFSFAEAPSYLKFNPYITGGYRSALTPKECVKSLFWWTNETLNIWSHLIGWLFFLVLSVYDSLGLLNLPTTQPWDQLIFTLLLVCFQACMLLSALYHVFCCCSEKFYRRWLSADLFGVSLSLLAIYISGIYYAFSCVPFWLNFYLITVGAIFASAMVCMIIPVVVKPTTEEAFHWRLIVFGGWAAYGVVPTFHWALLHGGMSSPVVSLLLPRIFWMYSISVAAFIFYVFRLPEKLYPGSVNYIFSSHQLWHLLIVCALYWWHNTGLLYLQFRANNSCEAEYAFLFPSEVISSPVES